MKTKTKKLPATTGKRKRIVRRKKRGFGAIPGAVKVYSTKTKVLIGLAVLATGGLAFGGYKYYKKKQEDKANGNGETPNNTPGVTPPKKNNYAPILPPVDNGGGSGSEGFPLQAGSTGANVTALQNWLIAKGQKIPAGATGTFASQTAAALKAQTGQTSVSKADFDSWIGGSSTNTTTGAVGKTIIGGSGFATLQHIDSAGKLIPLDTEMFNQGKEIGVCYKEDNLYYYVVQTSGLLWNKQKKGYVFKQQTKIKP